MQPPPNRRAIASKILVLVLALGAGSIAVLAAPQEAREEPRARIVIPPPTSADIMAPPAPKALAMEIPEARGATIGGSMPTTFTFAAPGAKVAIIDSGFAGIKQWLDAHPEESAKTHYVTDPKFAGSDNGNHGYLVYRTARLVLSSADLYLYRVSNSVETLDALDDAGAKGIPIANVSLGIPNRFEIAERDSTKVYVDTLDRVLRKREIFAFFAIGNERQRVHSWISTDRDGDRYVDINPSGKPRDAFRTAMRAGLNTVYLTWDIEHYPQADYEVEFVSSKGKRIASARAEAKEPGIIKLEHKFAQMVGVYVRVKRLAGPPAGVFMRIALYGPTGHSDDFNGLQTALTYVFKENPFLIYVGAFGKTKTGTLTPAAFSDIGRGADGKLYPHVLGPGRLLLDGKEIDGTSFASPFLTAIYGLAVGYNIKNVLERTSTTASLDPGVGPHEGSRWGVPKGFDIFFQLAKVVGKTTVEDVSHEIDGDDLVLRFKVTRCCMEGMRWAISVHLYDPQTRRVANYPGTKEPFGKWVELRSDEQDYLHYPVEVRIPLKGAAQAFKGRTLRVNFGHVVLAWRGISQSVARFNAQPVHEIAF